MYTYPIAVIAVSVNVLVNPLCVPSLAVASIHQCQSVIGSASITRPPIRLRFALCSMPTRNLPLFVNVMEVRNSLASPGGWDGNMAKRPIHNSFSPTLLIDSVPE